MTTVRNSPRSEWIAALAFVIVAGISTSAHRRDEYLQAARLAIDPDRVQIALDLTPGIAVAEDVLAQLDADRDRSISPAEAHAYTERLLRGITVDVDGTPLVLDVMDSTFPQIGAVLSGEGTIRINAGASMPSLPGGVHRLRYRNNHRPDIAAYLANALVPSSERIAIAAERRSVDQRELTIEYRLSADRTTRIGSGLSVGVAGTMLWLGVVWWRRSRQPGRSLT